jgi:WhiB family redox-sensing transcriptional regulator
MDELWMSDAYCRDADPEAFFPEDGCTASKPKAICMMCSVTEECLQYALHYKLDDGVWGGMSSRDRKMLRIRNEKRFA